MDNLKNIKRVYFIGIAGVGMSALARYFLTKNILVGGYDRNDSIQTDTLKAESCQIIHKDRLNLIPASFYERKGTLIVYTPAISKSNRLFRHFSKHKFLLKKRAQILGEITKKLLCLAIAGTHGKTTISSMLSFILKSNQLNCWAFLGGVSKDFKSNFIEGSQPIAVVEADEFDRSFLRLSPNWALISSIDEDHMDIYGSVSNLVNSFLEFTKLVENRQVIAKEGLNISAKYTYAVNSNTSDFAARNIRIENGSYFFDIHYPNGVIEGACSGLPGVHNVENTIAAFSMAYLQGISAEDICGSIHSFSGIERRFEYHVHTDHKIYIDDYAHHPKEIEFSIQSVRELFPNKSLTVIFQPHLFSRTQDFMNEFALVLSTVDRLMLLDVYPAREMPIEGVNSNVLLSKVSCQDKGLYQKDSIIQYIGEIQVLMTLGAGDISDLVKPIKNYLRR